VYEFILTIYLLFAFALAMLFGLGDSGQIWFVCFPLSQLNLNWSADNFELVTQAILQESDVREMQS
jgi:hypothetical protein